jgi:galactose mutarotase-like enzyme
LTGYAALAADGASALVAQLGAELRSWRPAGGPELMWHGDPAHWPFWAPLLFPIVGSLKDDRYAWRGRSYAMFRHGFTRFRPFKFVPPPAFQGRDGVGGDIAGFELTDDETTRAEYPFAFRLLATYALTARTLELGFRVENPGKEAMPYALGWHPAFLWPFAGGDKERYRVDFEKDEADTVPALTATGLIRRDRRPSTIGGRTLRLSPALFEGGAILLADAASREMAFTAPDGAAIVMTAEDMPHLVVWTKPTAPYISLEAWTAHSDFEDGDGMLETKPGMRWLSPGETARHSVRLTWRPAGC